MVIANIGSIVLSLPSSSTASTISTLGSSVDAITSTQVRLVSISNTLSRLVAGPLADFTSPIASYLPSGARTYPRKHWISRVSFINGSAFTCIAAFASLELFIRTQENLWILRSVSSTLLVYKLHSLIKLSVLIGSAYGVMFTIL